MTRSTRNPTIELKLNAKNFNKRVLKVLKEERSKFIGECKTVGCGGKQLIDQKCTDPTCPIAKALRIVNNVIEADQTGGSYRPPKKDQ